MPIKKGEEYEHFHSKEKYDRYIAYIHIHGIPHKHHDCVIINGKKHKVCKNEK